MALDTAMLGQPKSPSRAFDQLIIVVRAGWKAAMDLDVRDRELLRLIDQCGSYSPMSSDERGRLDWLADIGLIWRRERPYNAVAGSRPLPDYFLTERGKKQIRKG
jgi:hypothetical protein